MIRSLLVLFFLGVGTASAQSVVTPGSKTLPLPGEAFQIDGHDAFIILPPDAKKDIPWVWYAPTLPGLPATSEVWMFEQFLAKGIAIAGIDAGESFGSPKGTELYASFYEHLVKHRQCREKPCLLARSRGGLMLYSWAVQHAQSVGGVAGIYPVCNIASYPGVARAASAFELTAEQLESDLAKHNPIDRLKPLAEAGVPVFHIHGDSDTVVPLEANSAELAQRYREFGGTVEVEVVTGQGHNMWDGWFTSQKLTDFVIARALGQPVEADEAVVDISNPNLQLNPRTISVALALADEPKQGDAKKLDLGNRVGLELLYIPPGSFMMGSTAAEKEWATGIEGGAQPGTIREKYEGEPRPMRVGDGFWMGRTEVTMAQFRQFVEATGYVTDAEKPGGWTQCFDFKWDRYYTDTGIVHPWERREDKSWRDPNFGVPMQDEFPVVCVSYQDMKAFCSWLTKNERGAGRLSDDLEIRLPTEAEWAYACRGGSQESHYFWWGNDLMEGKGRLNISAVDFLPGRDTIWPLANAPWSDGFAFLSPVDHYGEKGRNGFGLADMCGGVWEFTLDHFDPEGGHEEIHYENNEQLSVSSPVCRGGNYFDVPGNARCAVRLGIHNISYSDSRDGFRICLGVSKKTVPQTK